VSDEAKQLFLDLHATIAARDAEIERLRATIADDIAEIDLLRGALKAATGGGLRI
jgi:cell division protein FtsB